MMHAPINLTCFWFGPKMSQDRAYCFRTIVKNCRVKVNLITEENLSDWLIPEAPIHHQFRHLSATHKADYLRAYFMYHYGGGYSDIKKCHYDWGKYFDLLNSSDAYCIGYKETSMNDIAYPANMHMYEKMIGCGSFIFKPKTELAKDWIDSANLILDSVSSELENNPATNDYPQAIRGMAIKNGDKEYEGYPLDWATICGTIFHRIQPNYFNRIMFGMPYIDTTDYR